MNISRPANVYPVGLLRRLSREARLRTAESFLARLFVAAGKSDESRHRRALSASNVQFQTESALSDAARDGMRAGRQRMNVR